MEARREEVAHALGVVDATLELVARELVGDPADHGALPPVRGRGRRPPPRRLVLGRHRPRPRGSAGGVAVGRWRRGGGDVGDGPADGAADAGRPVRQLQRRPAARAVDQHHHLSAAGEEGGGESAGGFGWQRFLRWLGSARGGVVETRRVFASPQDAAGEAFFGKDAASYRRSSHRRL